MDTVDMNEISLELLCSANNLFGRLLLDKQKEDRCEALFFFFCPPQANISIASKPVRKMFSFNFH